MAQVEKSLMQQPASVIEGQWLDMHFRYPGWTFRTLASDKGRVMDLITDMLTPSKRDEAFDCLSSLIHLQGKCDEDEQYCKRRVLYCATTLPSNCPMPEVQRLDNRLVLAVGTGIPWVLCTFSPAYDTLLDTGLPRAAQSCPILFPAMVREFAQGNGDTALPSRPTSMSKDSVRFITRMIMSELHELAQTVCPTTQDCVLFMEECLYSIDCKQEYVMPTEELDKISEQADAFVDIEYYMLDTAAKKLGVNLGPVAALVHQANMNKRFSDDLFHRREDGKILKPDGWKEPDVAGEISRQMREGAW